MDINLLSGIWFADIFFHSAGYLFILLMVFFAIQKLFSLMYSGSYILPSHFSIGIFIFFLLAFKCSFCMLATIPLSVFMYCRYVCHVCSSLNSFFWCHLSIKSAYWASLVAQWLRILLPMQGTQVWALVWEDPTCSGATEARTPRAHAPQQEKPPQWEAHAPQQRVAHTCRK